MLERKTPPIGARGRYILTLPWFANPSKLYTCIAIRSLADIYKSGLDAYTVFYKTMGLIDGETFGTVPFIFSVEALRKPNIISLRADDGETIYVPDNFIQSFPNMGEVKYNHMVLSLSLGPIPDYVNLDAVKSAIADAVRDNVGVTPTIREHVAPSTDNPTAEQHEALEIARTAAISHSLTDRVLALAHAAESAAKQLTINDLVGMLKAHNVPPFNT